MKTCCKFWHELKVKALEKQKTGCSFETEKHIKEMRSCPECREDFTGHKICQYCNGINNQGLNICVRCGRPLDA